MNKVMIIIFIIGSFFMGIKLKLEDRQLKAISIADINLKDIRDGEYYGECLLELTTAKVNVEVKDGIIKNIELVQHNHGSGYGADEMIKRIIDSQNLDVDAITGATKSSIVMKKAIENALKKGFTN